MKYEWDEAKNRKNFAKHGLSFEDAEQVFPGACIGHVGAFQSSVSFQITTVPGIKNLIFGGDGIFLAALTGPGRIWLQTLPISKLAHALAEFMPHQARKETVEGGVVGGIVGSILDQMK
jgi:hypothetical protein